MQGISPVSGRCAVGFCPAGLRLVGARPLRQVWRLSPLATPEATEKDRKQHREDGDVVHGSIFWLPCICGPLIYLILV